MPHNDAVIVHIRRIRHDGIVRGPIHDSDIHVIHISYYIRNISPDPLHLMRLSFASNLGNGVHVERITDHT